MLDIRLRIRLHINCRPIVTVESHRKVDASRNQPIPHRE